MHTKTPRFWVSIIIPSQYIVFIMFSKSCFATSHVILKNSWLIPSRPGTFLVFPVVTAVRTSKVLLVLPVFFRILVAVS